MTDITNVTSMIVILDAFLTYELPMLVAMIPCLLLWMSITVDYKGLLSDLFLNLLDLEFQLIWDITTFLADWTPNLNSFV